MKMSPSPSGNILHPLAARTESKKRTTDPTGLRPSYALVTRYYPAVYNFASRLVDEPWEAAVLTHLAFLSVRKQTWRPRDETALIRTLLKAVVRAGLKAA